MDTIYALSSGALPSGVAVIRVSGKETPTIVHALVGKAIPPRLMHYTTLKDREGGFLDKALVVFFKGPHSFTGEDSAEFHLHGGKALVAHFLGILATFAHCRPAQAGEFAKRAFFHGKIDLTEAEGLADLIEAETESQRHFAVMGASKALSALYRSWRQDLIEMRAWIEAHIDFSDEEDVAATANLPWDRLEALEKALHTHRVLGERAYKLRDGLKLVIAGPPNAGKSSFINRLCGDSVAIVNEKPGTTRDALERFISIAGVRILVTDTAGLHETDDPIEQIGIKKAQTLIEEADLVLYLEDMETASASPGAAERAQLWKIDKTKLRGEVWSIGNKRDRFQGDEHRWPLQISAQTGENFSAFLEKLEAYVSEKKALLTQLIPARHRQMQLLKEAETYLQQAYNYRHKAEEVDGYLDIVAEYLRLASAALGRITGDIAVEDFLDVIFSEFCIGK